MATTKASKTSSSCLSFLKDALLLPTQNAKLFVPVFLLVITAPLLLLQITNVFCIQPLAADMLHLIDEIKNVDPSSADYATLMAEIMKEARELVMISIAFVIFTFAESFARQIIAFFAAATTYAGDRYSLPELFAEVIMKGRRVRGPLVTVAMAAALNVACMLLLAALLQLVMRKLGVGSMAAFLVVLPGFLAFLYLNVVFFVAVAASVADADRRGVSALGLAWRLMTKVWRKQGCVLVAVVHLVATAPSPLYAVALACLKKKSSLAVGMALLCVYALLSGLVQLFYFAAAMVYYYQAMESKEVVMMMAHDDDYVKIPAGEATA